jgi:hypothetical protein
MKTRPKFGEVVEGLETTSDKIRALARAGYPRTEIAKLLQIRYQHVRKVLVDAGISDGLQNRVEAERPPILVEPPEDKNREETSCDVLIKAGFQHVGNWTRLPDGVIKIEGTVPSHPGVYALVLDNVVVYVGLTLNGLQTRMDQYRRGHKGQRTSARVNGLIGAALAEGREIKVLVAAPQPLEWNGLPVNTAAGLEAGLITLISPLWNIQGSAR